MTSSDEMALWHERVGRPICVTMIPAGGTEPHTESGVIVRCFDETVRCKSAHGTLFEFRACDVEDATNFRGTILVHLVRVRDLLSKLLET